MNVYTELNRNPLNSCRDISTKDKNVNLTVVLQDNFQPRRIEDAWKHNKQHHMNVCTKNFIHLYFSQVAGATDPQTDRLCRPSSHAAGTAEKINTLSFAYELGFPPNVFFFFFLNHLTYKDTVNKKGWRVWNFIINSKCFLWKFPCFILLPDQHSHHLSSIHTFLGKAVYLHCFDLVLSHCTLTHLLSLPNPSISPGFPLLPFLLPFLSAATPLCDNIDYCSACASTCWISNRPLQQKPRAMVSPLCSPRISTSPAAVPTILQPPSPPRLCRSTCCIKEKNKEAVCQPSLIDHQVKPGNIGTHVKYVHIACSFPVGGNIGHSS